MWEALRPLLGGTHAVRIESRTTGSGTPDVNYNHGWVELKYLKQWPVRPATKVRIDHYTKEQRSWAIQRTQAGGKVFLLLKVGPSEWLLFQGAVAAQFLGHVCRQDLYTRVLARWLRQPRKAELAAWLLPPFRSPTLKPSSSGDAERG